MASGQVDGGPAVQKSEARAFRTPVVPSYEAGNVGPPRLVLRGKKSHRRADQPGGQPLYLCGRTDRRGLSDRTPVWGGRAVARTGIRPVEYGHRHNLQMGVGPPRPRFRARRDRSVVIDRSSGNCTLMEVGQWGPLYPSFIWPGTATRPGRTRTSTRVEPTCR